MNKHKISQIWVFSETKDKLYRLKGQEPRKSLMEIIDETVNLRDLDNNKQNEKKRNGIIRI